MQLDTLLSPERICLLAHPKTKEEAINQLIDLICNGGQIGDKNVFKQGVWQREKQQCTAIGEGIAIPHCKSETVLKPVLAAMVIPGGIEFNAPDGRYVDLVFLIAAPDTKADLHLAILGELAMKLLQPEVVDRLRSVNTVDEFIKIMG